jgi:DNA repair exonuclease SbcCD ATPase subunit
MISKGDNMSQDIEIDPDSRTITYYDSRTEQSIRDFIESGGKVLSRTDAITLLDEIDRLRKDCAHYKQAALDISDVNDHMRKQIDDQNRRMQDLFLKTELLEKLIPPETERGPGFVGQGSWSVFAEKVVEERDAAREGMKQLLKEKIELRDELSGLCEEIRCLKEENDELQEGMRLLVNATAYKKEHTNTHFNDKKDFVGLDGYGRFSVQKANDCLWILKLPNETVTFYNRKGRRVCANHIHSGDT